jgi:hypothetical protein
MEGHKNRDGDKEMSDAEASIGTNVQAMHSSFASSLPLPEAPAASQNDGTKPVFHYLPLESLVWRIWIKIMKLDYSEPLHDRVAELHERIIDQIACAKTEFEQDPAVNANMQAQMSSIDPIVRRDRSELAEQANLMLIKHRESGRGEVSREDFKGTTAMQWVFGTAWLLDWKLCLFRRGGHDGQLKTCARCRDSLTRDPYTGVLA